MTRNHSSAHDQVNHSDLPLETIEAVRSRLANTLLITCSIVAVPAVGMSVLRAKDIGWQPLFLVQIGLTVILWGATIFRAHVTFHQRNAIAIGLLGLFGVGGLFTFGLIGNGVVLFLLTCLTTAILLGRRIGLGVTAASGFIVLVTGIAVSQGLLRFHINLDVYATSFSSWLTASITLCAFTAIIVAGLGRMNEALTNSIRTLESRTAELQCANDRLAGEIEERKQMENALLESEKKFSTVFHLSPDALVISRLQDGLLFDISQGFTDITGYTKDDVAGKTGFDIDIWANPADRSRLESTFQKRKGSARIEAEFRTKHGRIKTGDVTATLVHIQGEPCMFINVKDITERKQMEMQIRESEATARALLNSPTDSIALLDTNGTFIDLNDVLVRNWGITREQVIGKTLFDLIPEPFATQRWEKFQHVITSKTFVRFEDERQGEWFDNVLHPILDAEGNVAKIAVFARDITVRKRAEEALRAERDFSMTVIQHSPTFFVAITADGSVQRMNQAMLTALAYHEDEVIGQGYLSTFVPGREHDMLLETFENLTKGEGTLNENHVLRKDGRELLVEWHGAPIFNTTLRF